MVSRGSIISEHYMGQEMPISAVLSAYAAGENCDGEPYDTMQAAAEYILSLEEENARLRAADWTNFSERYKAQDEARRAESDVVAIRSLVDAREPNLGKKATTLAVTVRALEQKLKVHKRDLTDMNQALERKNRELDALHYVWCDGGCPSGVHRYNEGGPETVTFDIVNEAMRNTERLSQWWHARQHRNRQAGKTMDERRAEPVNLIRIDVFRRWQRSYESKIKQLEAKLASCGKKEG